MPMPNNGIPVRGSKKNMESTKFAEAFLTPCGVKAGWDARETPPMVGLADICCPRASSG